MAKKIRVPHDSVLVRHADANASCSYGQAEDGLLIVPAEAVEELRAHSFTPDGELAEQDAQPEPQPEPQPDPEPVLDAESVIEAAPELELETEA
jgi:hypothetical protein